MNPAGSAWSFFLLEHIIIHLIKLSLSRKNALAAETFFAEDLYTSFFCIDTNVSAPGETANPNSPTSGNLLWSCTKIWKRHENLLPQAYFEFTWWLEKMQPLLNYWFFHFVCTFNPAENSGPKKYSLFCWMFMRSQRPPAVPVLVVFRENPNFFRTSSAWNW